MQKNQKINELRSEILAWVKKNKLQQKKFYSIPIRRMVHFPISGFKHSAYRHHKAPEVELQLLKRVHEVLTNSYYVGFEKNTKDERHVKGTHYYYNIVFCGGRLYEIWIKVKETRDKTYFYDLGVIKEL